jgi:hypothetical protein
MNYEDIEYALFLNGVMPKDIEYILNLSKENGVSYDIIDEELVKMGYEKIFDAEDDWDNDFNNIEKFNHRHKYSDEYD